MIWGRENLDGGFAASVGPSRVVLSGARLVFLVLEPVFLGYFRCFSMIQDPFWWFSKCSRMLDPRNLNTVDIQ